MFQGPLPTPLEPLIASSVWGILSRVLLTFRDLPSHLCQIIMRIARWEIRHLGIRSALE